jgi:hypothetical protein
LPPKQLTRENVLETFPCFGHFGVHHCLNLGYLKHKRNSMGVLIIERCPLERLCKQESMKYAKNMDVYNSGQVDIPRHRIRELEKR